MTIQFMINNLISPDWRIALIAAAAFAATALAFRLLTVSGAIATFCVGFVVFGLGGGKFAVPLLMFFLTSSLLSRASRRRKSTARDLGTKGATRDYLQVLANGGAAAALVIVFRIVVHRWPIEDSRCLLMLYLAALATVNADTWATELGAFSPTPPRLLNNWKPAASGASGAVTLLGTCAALGGSLAVTIAGWLVWRLTVPEFIAVLWAGFIGSLFDSVLGASIQALYRHPITGDLSERSSIDGVKMLKERGVKFVNNDTVNFLASVGGVVCAWALLRYCAYPFR